MTGLQWLSSELTALDTGILLGMNSLGHSAQEDLDECEPPQTILQDLLKDLDHDFTESDTEVCLLSYRGRYTINEPSMMSQRTDIPDWWIQQ